MPKVHFVSPDGGEHIVDVPVGENLKQAAIDNMVPGIRGDCGGFASCGTCHGYIDHSFQKYLSAPSEDEEFMLEGLLVPATDESRLTCQIDMTDDLTGVTVRIPEQF